MVSSKWIQVESPSPFRFLAALMPPCAHTECERFTGTIENRSTSPPISAILMTADKPARPPPTTIIFGAAMLYESDLLSICSRAGPGPASTQSLVVSRWSLANVIIETQQWLITDIHRERLTTNNQRLPAI